MVAENIVVMYNTDQVILDKILYKNFNKQLLVHSTQNIFNDLNFRMIPHDVSDKNFCGQVYDFDDNNVSYLVHKYKEYNIIKVNEEENTGENDKANTTSNITTNTTTNAIEHNRHVDPISMICECLQRFNFD